MSTRPLLVCTSLVPGDSYDTTMTTLHREEIYVVFNIQYVRHFIICDFVRSVYHFDLKILRVSV